MSNSNGVCHVGCLKLLDSNPCCAKPFEAVLLVRCRLRCHTDHWQLFSLTPLVRTTYPGVSADEVLGQYLLGRHVQLVDVVVRDLVHHLASHAAVVAVSATNTNVRFGRFKNRSSVVKQSSRARKPGPRRDTSIKVHPRCISGSCEIIQ